MEKENCSVCGKPSTKIMGTCLCLPTHGSWHIECDPHLQHTEDSWEESFYELTKTMDGQFRPELKLLIDIEKQLSYQEGVLRVQEMIRSKESEIIPDGWDDCLSWISATIDTLLKEGVENGKV